MLGWKLGTGTLPGITVPMAGMAGGMIPGTPAVSGRGMTRSTGIILIGTISPGTDRIMAMAIMVRNTRTNTHAYIL